MSAREWKPGDVALVRAKHGPGADDIYPMARSANGWMLLAEPDYYWPDPLGHPVRPLVVIDPEDAEAVTRLAVAWGMVKTAEFDDTPISVAGARMREALRSIANPTPLEPTDPTARVTDRRENVWRLLADGDWVCTSGPDHGEYLVWSRLVADRGPLQVEVAS